MAIKILERGIDPRDKVYTCKCSTCGTKLQFIASDATLVKASHQRDVDTLYVYCPVCTKSIAVCA